MSDKYEIVRVLAKTSHSTVYLVRHKILDVYRAAKVVMKNCEDYERILREADLIKNLKCPGIPVIFDIEDDSDSICIIEEYIAGKSLSEYISGLDNIPVGRIADICIKICDIVSYLHEYAGIIHLDLKPSNIIIREETQDSYDIFVIDFDSSDTVMNGTESKALQHDIGRQHLCRKDEGIVGRRVLSRRYITAGYAAPEQYHGYGSVRSDIYSIGMLLLYMVSDDHMQSFTAQTDRVCRLYSNSIGPVIRKCIRHNSIQRYSSIASLKKELCSISDTLNYKKMTKKNIMNRFLGLFGEKKFGMADINNIEKVHHIYVYGLKPRIGATHFCLCFASFLTRKNKKVICIRHNDISDYRQLTDNRPVKDGIYTIKGTAKNKGTAGIDIMPDYNDCIVCDLKKYTYVIHDCGDISYRDEYREKDGVSIYVGNIGYRRDYMKAMEKLDDDSIIFINYISGMAFYDFANNYNGRCRIYRFPCMYEWESENELFEEAAGEVLKSIDDEVFREKV